MSNLANLFYDVQGAEEEYFGNQPAEGNICIGKGLHNPKKEYSVDYEKMLHLLKDYQWNYRDVLPGSDKLKSTLLQVLDDFN